jgi:adenosylcobinamide kinase/adenosylcobinamide-phosphate guanylyltransferase
MKNKPNPNLTLITGGARSGKSTLALKIANDSDGENIRTVSFIATMEPNDSEMIHRVNRHRQVRPATWQTIEEPIDIADVIDKCTSDVIIIDCISMWLTNILFEILGDFNKINQEFDEKQLLKIDNSINESLTKLLLSLTNSKSKVLCVTNEVGFGVIPPTPVGRIFRDYLGHVNQNLARIAKSTLLVVAGKVIELK